MASKMGKKLVLLCSIAIGTIYTAGYMVTEPNVIPTPTNDKQNKSALISTTQKPTLDKKNSFSAANQKIYRDGTYYGSGTNRIGTVEVAITIKNGMISNVEITKCTTSYPQSYIDHLPDQVVARQSDKVDVVTGATKSTEDFQMAVHQALEKAKQPNSIS